jgi:hypothetical protein
MENMALSSQVKKNKCLLTDVCLVFVFVFFLYYRDNHAFVAGKVTPIRSDQAKTFNCRIFPLTIRDENLFD